jgi:hypothetical protein
MKPILFSGDSSFKCISGGSQEAWLLVRRPDRAGRRCNRQVCVHEANGRYTKVAARQSYWIPDSATDDADDEVLSYL